MKIYNIPPGLLLTEVPSKKINLCRFVAKVAECIGDVAEVRIKGVFSHYHYEVFGFCCCLDPAHERYEADFDIDPETGEIIDYHNVTVQVSEKWYFYRR